MTVDFTISEKSDIMTEKVIPSVVFIIPYRNRENDKIKFMNHMKYILQNDNTSMNYEFYFSHQYDKRSFNRGAMKNIGFLAIKQKYPNDYKDITFVFNDVDTMPTTKDIIDYNTVHGVVKHYYGFQFALGGIFSIKGADFEKSKGFPNFWGWGIEDNAMNDRCLEAGLVIDRSQFYIIGDKRIINTFNGYNRIISKKDSLIYKKKQHDNMFDLKNVRWNIVNEYINVTQFEAKMDPNEQVYQNFNTLTSRGKIRVPKETQFRRDWSMFKR